MPRYDWERIREEYVSGTDSVTHQSLADKYGCGRVSISRRAGREDWNDQRIQWRYQVATKTREKASTKEAEIRVRHMDIARKMLNPAVAILESKADLEIIASRLALDPSELRLFIKDATDIERKAGGIPDEKEIQTIVEGKMSSEVDIFIQQLKSKLSPDTLKEVLDALSD